MGESEFVSWWICCISILILWECSVFNHVMPQATAPIKVRIALLDHLLLPTLNKRHIECIISTCGTY